MIHAGLLLLIALLALGAPSPGLAGSGNLMLILDASGSMWGQLEGRSKIEIAREVMAGLVRDLPADLNVALVAYGHRRKGDCADVEQIVPLAPLDKAALVQEIQRLSPKGKTPLSNSVREVARSLQHLEDETTILLVSDGKETCGGDPCVLVRELKAAGIKFVLHVVGFDVNAAERLQLQCMADEGGGTYYSAANAGEFRQAVQEIQRTGQLKVVALRNGQPIVATVAVTVDGAAVAGGETNVTRGQPVAFKLDAGRYRVTVTDPAIPDLAPVVFDAVELGGGDVVERIAAFAPAQLRLTATKNSRPTAATYLVTPAGQGTTLATATSPGPQAFWLAPGSVDIAITEGGVGQPETVRFAAVALTAGQTVERTADFSAGRLRIHATRNGQPIRARVEVLVPDEEREVGSFHTSTDPKRPGGLELKPGVYTAVVIDESSPGRPEVVLAHLEVGKGRVVEQTADFSDGTLQLIALRNGQLIPAAVEVIPQDKAQVLATETTTVELEKPVRLTLPLGAYRLRVTDTENPAKPSVELTDVVINAGKANEQVAEFRAAILELKAVKNKKPVAALAALAPLPDQPKQTVLLSATEQPKRLFLEPGSFDLVVRHGKGEEERTAEFKGIAIALGDTVKKVADFSDGVVVVKASRNGRPDDGEVRLYKVGDADNPAYSGSLGGDGVRQYEVFPRTYDIWVRQTLRGYSTEVQWIRGVVAKSGEEVVVEAKDLQVGYIRPRGTRNGKPGGYAANIYSAAEGGKQVTSCELDRNGECRREVLPGIYEVGLSHSLNGFPRERSRVTNVEVAAGEEVLVETPDFKFGYIRAKATRNGTPGGYSATFYSVADDGRNVASCGLESAGECRSELLPGTYDVGISHSLSGYPSERSRVRGVEVTAGNESVVEAPDFQFGYLKVKATRNGEPSGYAFNLYSSGPDSTRPVGWSLKNGERRIEILPGNYDIGVSHSADGYPAERARVNGIAVRAGEEVVVQTPDFKAP